MNTRENTQVMDSLDYEAYLQKVGFRFYGPLSRLKGFRRLTDLSAKLGLLPEIINTRLPAGERLMKRRLSPLCRIPRMSTFAIGAIINYTVSRVAFDTSFVNVGVWHGFTLLSGMIGNPTKKCVGIDNFSEFGSPRKEFLERFYRYKSVNHFFFDQDYLEYFAHHHTGKIGFYIYDGYHDYDSQMKGLQVASPFFAPNCIILVDDTNNEYPRQATLDFIAQTPHQYRLLLDVKTWAPKIETDLGYFHPTFWNGIMVFRKCQNAESQEKRSLFVPTKCKEKYERFL